MTTYTDDLEQYVVKLHHEFEDSGKCVVEIRPRAGTWPTFFCSMPMEEKDDIEPHMTRGPKDIPIDKAYMINNKNYEENGKWIMSAENKASPAYSYFLWCKKFPTHLKFGEMNNPEKVFEWENDLL